MRSARCEVHGASPARNVDMCYSIYLSTNSCEDLSQLKSEEFSLVRLPLSNESDYLDEIDNSEEAQLLRLLSYSNNWYLSGKHGGCSCHFRHTEAGYHPTTKVTSMPYFSVPEDWSPEDPEEVESTVAFYDAIVQILAAGHQVEILDAWTGTKPTRIRSIPVALSKVPREKFRFFNGFRFILEA